MSTSQYHDPPFHRLGIRPECVEPFQMFCVDVIWFIILAAVGTRHPPAFHLIRRKSDIRKTGTPTKRKPRIRRTMTAWRHRCRSAEQRSICCSKDHTLKKQQKTTTTIATATKQETKSKMQKKKWKRKVKKSKQITSFVFHGQNKDVQVTILADNHNG